MMQRTKKHIVTKEHLYDVPKTERDQDQSIPDKNKVRNPNTNRIPKSREYRLPRIGS